MSLLSLFPFGVFLLLTCRTGAVETAANASRGCAGLHTAKPHPNAPPRGICRTALLCHIQTGRRLHVRLVATDPPPSQQTARPGASQPAGKPLGYSAPPLPRPASAPNENVTNSHWQSGTASAASLPARQCTLMGTYMAQVDLLFHAFACNPALHRHASGNCSLFAFGQNQLFFTPVFSTSTSYHQRLPARQGLSVYHRSRLKPKRSKVNTE